MANMLTNSGIDCVNYDSTLIGFRNNVNTPNNITFGASGRVYSSTTAQAARNTLITQKSWVISGDSFNSTCAALGNENFVILNTKIYPNPAQNIVNVEVDGLNEMEVYDINGRFLIKKQISDNKNAIDISSLSNGIYVLKVSTENGIGNFKIIKE
ncbi:T9SS type A sorting domain-containing protein [Flavobacterium sp.]|uniref:T9SS type A sorting domain-containing protein n=1 Tax=Flavobacterium sp. TaxID=239 RepID=UPI0037517CCF